MIEMFSWCLASFVLGFMLREWIVRFRNRKLLKVIGSGRKGELYRDKDLVIFVSENVSGEP